MRPRLASYINEAKWLFEHHASRTTLRLIEIASPFISEIPNRFPNDAKLLSSVAWLAWYDANALLVTGHGDEAMAIVDDVLPRVQPSWPDGELLRHNFAGVITDRLTELQVAHDYERSVAAVKNHVELCQASSACLNNLYLTFDAWCATYQATKDWPNAKKIMDRCIALLPGDTRCHDTLEKLTSLHP